ncbi:MAG TPA: aminotransferase class I/II-fold pyridoxal phosphate-dependent enzyme [Candidatus Nanopelagicales bacterium]
MILDLPLDRLRSRRSVKWQKYGPDVLPLWVAEMDVDLAAPIHDVVTAMVAQSDTGYTWNADLPGAYAKFAQARWALDVDPAKVYVLQDVMRGVLEVLQTGTAPDAGVVVNPPVYHPFFATIEHIGRRVVQVPLVVDDGGRYQLDLAGLERAFRDGARAYLMCSPHNPVGRVWSHDELRAVVALAAAHDVLLVVDEIHAPLVHAGSRFVPVHAVDEPGARDAIAVMSASKAWNLAGLKAAVVVAGSDRGWRTVASMGEEVGYGTGILGAAAALAAFTDGADWLDELLADLEHRRTLLADLLAEHLPTIGYRLPEATFLAWLDCRALGLADPYAHFLQQAKVALQPGEEFGDPGKGFVRLNFATSEQILTDAVQAMARSL